MNNVGIIQGRLSQPILGFQRTPEDWFAEFKHLDVLGLSHIEWIVVGEDLKTNPVFSIDSIPMERVSGVCLDNLVDTRIDRRDFIEENFFIPCEVLRKRGVRNVSIPLLEKSSLEDSKQKYDNFKSILKEAVDQFEGINFSLETELSLQKTVDLCKVSDRVRITYDTGNTTSYGIKHEDFVSELFERIDNVHLKDRTVKAVSKPPTQGDTDFKKIFSLLKKRNYKKLYTLQTMREESGKEIETVSRHLKILRKLFEDAT